MSAPRFPMTPSFLKLGAAMLASAAVTACAPSLGPPPPAPRGPAPVISAAPPAPATAPFSARDFAWSQRPGANVIAGRVGFKQGSARYTCAGASVVLTPETPWSRVRMAVLYGSTEKAALPADEVRARTPRAPAGDAGPFVKRTTCDDADQFAFGGLADGAWFAITVVRPASGGGDTVALMRRVVVRGGKTVPVVL